MRYLLLLTLIAAMPAMAREPNYNYAGVLYQHGHDLSILNFVGGMEFGENWHGTIDVLKVTENNSANLHDAEGFGIGIRRHWTVTEHGDLHVGVRVAKIHYDFHAFGSEDGYLYQPGIGFVSGIGDHVIASIEAAWNINKVPHANKMHYWHYTARLEVYPFDGSEFSVGVRAHYDEYNHEFRPGIDLSWHW